MEVRHILQTRDDLAREIAELIVPAKGTRDLNLTATIPGKTSAISAEVLAKSALEHFALSLTSAEVILWKPNLFDAAMYNRELNSGRNIDRTLLPSILQIWFPDTSDGKSRVWAELEKKHSQDGKNPLRLECIILGLEPYQAMSAKAKTGETVDIPKMIEEMQKRGLHDDKDPANSSFCPVVYIFRKKQGKREIVFHISWLNAGRVVTGSEYCFIPYAGLSFMQQQFVTRDRFPVNRKPGKFRFPQKYPYRSMVQSLVLRERITETIGEKPEPADTPSETKEHEFCWNVRPHTRTMFKGTEREKTVRIRHHIRGDKSKPLRPPRDRIVHVIR